MILGPDLQMVGLKMIPRPTRHKVETHYSEHMGRDYFPWLCDQLDGHPIIAIAISGKNAIARIREIVGPTKPEDNPSNTVRGRFSTDRFDTSRKEQRAVNNVVHAASSAEDAKLELGIWFNLTELL